MSELHMTFSSLYVCELPDEVTEEELQLPQLRGDVLHDLNGIADRCTLWKVREWAETNGLAQYFVDSCWVRIPVTGLQLEAFFAGPLQGIEPSPLILRSSRDAFVIEAEEF